MIEVSPNLKIEIRPIPNRKGIREFSDNLEFFSQANIIAPFVNPQTLKYDTGLSKEDLDYLKDKKCPYNLDDNYTPGQAHEFWESNLVKTELLNTPTFLYPGKSLLDFIKWKYLLVNQYIYKSENEMNSGSKPQATHYIYNESDEIEVKATKLERYTRLINNISELSLDRKRKILTIINEENPDNKSENYLTVKFDEIINNKEKRTLLEELLKEDQAVISTKALIKKGILLGLIRRTKTGYYYFETNLGFQLDDVVEFLNKAENQEILLNIKTKID